MKDGDWGEGLEARAGRGGIGMLLIAKAYRRNSNPAPKRTPSTTNSGAMPPPNDGSSGRSRRDTRVVNVAEITLSRIGTLFFETAKCGKRALNQKETGDVLIMPPARMCTVAPSLCKNAANRLEIPTSPWCCSWCVRVCVYPRKNDATLWG